MEEQMTDNALADAIRAYQHAGIRRKKLSMQMAEVEEEYRKTEHQLAKLVAHDLPEIIGLARDMQTDQPKAWADGGLR